MKPAYRSGFWAVPLAITVLVGVVGWRAHSTVKTSIKGKLEEELRTVLSADVTALEIWMESQQRAASAIADDPWLRRTVMDLFDQYDNTPLEPAELKRMDLQLELARYLYHRVQQLGYPGFALVHPDGVVLSCDDLNLIGRRIGGQADRKLANLFNRAQPQLLTPFRGLPETDDPPPRPPIMAVLAPVMEAVEAPPEAESSPPRVTAALGLIIRPELEFTRILSVARSGYTGETFAFDEDGLLLSQSRFDAQLRAIGLLPPDPEVTSVLNVTMRNPGGDLTSGHKPELPREKQPLTLIAASAVATGSGVAVEGFRDYRGVEVVGAWQWLARYGFGMATKQDVAEAYKPLLDLERAFGTLVGALIAATLGMFSYSYVTFKLRERVSKVEWEAKKLGQYTLDEKIGEGGMGAVYRAHHALLRRPTAVKLLLPNRAEKDSIGRFEREVQLTSQLTHPNTIQIYDYGRTPDGIFYYAMEYLDGITIKTLVGVDGPQPASRIIHILVQICHSLREAHAAQLVHRDIKPANIIISARGGLFDTVKVLDFGLVQNVGQNNDSAARKELQRSITGTPHYMSPECIAKPLSVDARSDFYSLGALGYFMLTGFEVFEGSADGEICQQHLHTEPSAPSSRFRKPYPADLEAILMQCLAKAPGDRPSDAAELIRLLNSCNDAGQWTEAAAQAWWERFHRPPPELEPPGRISRTVKIDPAMQIDLSERE